MKLLNNQRKLITFLTVGAFVVFSFPLNVFAQAQFGADNFVEGVGVPEGEFVEGAEVPEGEFVEGAGSPEGEFVEGAEVPEGEFVEGAEVPEGEFVEGAEVPEGEFVEGAGAPEGEFVEGAEVPEGEFVEGAEVPEGEFVEGAEVPEGEFVEGAVEGEELVGKNDSVNKSNIPNTQQAKQLTIDQSKELIALPQSEMKELQRALAEMARDSSQKDLYQELGGILAAEVQLVIEPEALSKNDGVKGINPANENGFQGPGPNGEMLVDAPQQGTGAPMPGEMALGPQGPLMGGGVGPEGIMGAPGEQGVMMMGMDGGVRPGMEGPRIMDFGEFMQGVQMQSMGLEMEKHGMSKEKVNELMDKGMDMLAQANGNQNVFGEIVQLAMNFSQGPQGPMGPAPDGNMGPPIPGQDGMMGPGPMMGQDGMIGPGPGGEMGMFDMQGFAQALGFDPNGMGPAGPNGPNEFGPHDGVMGPAPGEFFGPGPGDGFFGPAPGEFFGPEGDFIGPPPGEFEFVEPPEFDPDNPPGPPPGCDSACLFETALNEARVVATIVGFNPADNGITNRNLENPATNYVVNLAGIANADLTNKYAQLNPGIQQQIYLESLFDQYSASDEARKDAICDLNHDHGHSHTSLTEQCHTDGNN
ncbi:MAG: hypothetical protein H6755_06600 [Candidatus Omnitrophica bacterium]|nr:hypothetical protein [Candidatus Omnitrophota bacterium]